MIENGIHKKNYTKEEYNLLLQKIINNIKMHNSLQNENYFNFVESNLMEESIILGTPILMNFDNNLPMGACTVIDFPIDGDYESIKFYIKNYAELGLGFGVALDDIKNPIGNNIYKTVNQS